MMRLRHRVIPAAHIAENRARDDVKRFTDGDDFRPRGTSRGAQPPMRQHNRGGIIEIFPDLRGPTFTGFAPILSQGYFFQTNPPHQTKAIAIETTGEPLPYHPNAGRPRGYQLPKRQALTPKTIRRMPGSGPDAVGVLAPGHERPRRAAVQA